MGTSMKTNSPFEEDCTSRAACVASFVSCTVAPVTAPPLGSVTVPRMRPPVLCAIVFIHRKVARHPAKDTHRTLFHDNVRKNLFDFIELTPEPQSQNLHRDFEVECAPETLL